MNFDAFYKVTYGLYVVCAGCKDDMNGYIANTVFQVTAEPPMFAISCNIKNRSAEFIEKYRAFSFSVLSKTVEKKIITDFGFNTGSEINKFDGKQYKLGESGTPILLSGCIAAFECKLVHRFEMGTHVIFVGEVTSSELLVKNGDPLTYAYYRDFFRASSPANAPTYIPQDKKIKETAMAGDQKYLCPICGYVYDPALGDATSGIAAGTPFSDLPDDWECPVCSANKSVFISD